ncbi:MAG: hypothetical protein IT373_20705 [Polyangiaceae bacterium]|nr:hypothetical protein [Polyangiaceae bacterium]
MSTELERLEAFSAIVPETADLAEVRRYAHGDVNLNAARVRAAAQLHEHDEVVDEAIVGAQKQAKKGNRTLVATHAVDTLFVAFGRRVLDLVPGRVSVEVDARLAHNTKQLVDRARSLVDRFEQVGAGRHRVLVKMPATWEAIRAVGELADDGIRSHLTQVFGLHQAAAAADAGADVVEIAVGRITDWQKSTTGGADIALADDLGVKLTGAIFSYLHHHHYPTKTMAGTFRSTAQALALAGCDAITLPAKLIDMLAEGTGPVEWRLQAEHVPEPTFPREAWTASSFGTRHAADPLAQAKLAEGMRSGHFTLSALEKQIGEWITRRQDRAAATSTTTLFGIWDFNGDGYIDREEWAGSDAVFNAIDRDNNGRISLQELAEALGAPYQPPE